MSMSADPCSTPAFGTCKFKFVTPNHENTAHQQILEPNLKVEGTDCLSQCPEIHHVKLRAHPIRCRAMPRAAASNTPQCTAVCRNIPPAATCLSTEDQRDSAHRAYGKICIRLEK